MGIKNLMKLIDKYSPNSIVNTKITDYNDTILGIDSSLMIYKLIYAIRKNGYDIKNNDIIVTHIHAMLQKLLSFHKHNIFGVFVFDNKPHQMKENTLNKRDKQNIINKQKYELDNERFFYLKTDISNKEIQECKELIDIFGYQCIDAFEEADSQLAYMSKMNIIDAIVSDDMDILTFGGKFLLKNFSVSDKEYIQEISLDILLKDLNITYDQFIDLCILLGCDYCENIKGIGPVKVFNMIKGDDKITINNFHQVKQYFLDCPHKKVKIKKNTIDINKLVTFLKQYNFSDKYINKVVDKLNK